MKAKTALDKFVRKLSWYAVIPLIIIDLAATPVDVIAGVSIPFAGTITSSYLAGIIGFFATLIAQVIDRGYQKDDIAMALIAGFLVAVPLPVVTIALGGYKVFKK